MKPSDCPPEPPESFFSGTDPDTTIVAPRQGKPATENNLDKTRGPSGSAPLPPEHLGSGGLSPATMQMKFLPPPTQGDLPVPTQSDAGVRFSAGLGLSANNPHESAGILMPNSGVSQDPHLLSSYRIRSANGAIWTASGSTATIRAPSATTVLSQLGMSQLQCDFYKSIADPLPPDPWKKITITRLTSGIPVGYHKGWQFDVAYPGGGGLANTTYCYITNPGSTTAKTMVSANGHLETWTSSVSGTGLNTLRTAVYREEIDGALVKHAIATWSVTPSVERERLASSTLVLDAGTSELTTTYSYWNAPGSANDGQLLKATYPDGSWSLHARDHDPDNDPDTHQTMELTVTPFGSTTPPNVANVTTFGGIAAIALNPNIPSVATYVTTSDTSFAYSYGHLPAGFVLSQEKRIAGTLVERRVFFDDHYEDLNGTNPADLKILSTVGDWVGSGSAAIQVNMTGRNGLAPSSGDFTKRTSTSHVHDHPNDKLTTTTEGQGDSYSSELFKDISISHRSDGRPHRLERQLNDVAYEVTQWGYDAAERETSRTVNGVLQESWAYPVTFTATAAVTAVTHATDDGTRTTTEYDAYGRPVLEKLHGAAAATVFSTSLPAQGDIVSTWAYTARAGGLPGYVSTRWVSAASVNRETIEEFDGAGRLVYRKEPDAVSRYHEYTWNSGGGSVHSVYPGSPAAHGALLSEESYHRDGTMLALSGPAEVATDWLYSVPASYRQITTRKVAGQIVDETTTDGFGRIISVKAPVSVDSAGNAILFTSSYGWNTGGRLAWRSRPQPSGGLFYEVWKYYPSTGEVQSGLSLDTELNLVNDTSLRSTITATAVDGSIPSLTVDGTAVSIAWRTESTIMPTATGSSWEPTAARIRKTTLSERPVTSWLSHSGDALPLTYLNDGGTVYTEALHRTWSTSLDTLSTQRRVLRNSTQYRKVISRSGLDYAFTSPEAANIMLPYNAFREPLAEMSWNAIPHWPKLDVSPSTGQVTGQLLPNSSLYTVKYTYFTGTQDHRAGRVESATTWKDQPTSQALGTTSYHYNAKGQVLASYGSGTTPSAYIYDGAGRMTQLRTWQSPPSLSAGTIDNDLMTAAAAAQTTTWSYSSHPTLPLVRSKQHHGRPSAVNYTYALDGSLATRDWERTDGTARLRTTYVANNFGQTQAIHYGASGGTQTFDTNHPLYTPSVLMDYDRAGRLRHRTDASGTVLNSYRYDGGLLTEFTVDGNDAPLPAGRQLRRTMDTMGRQSRLESAWGSVLGAANFQGSATVSPYVDYYYGGADRLTGLGSGGMTGSITRTSTTDALSISAASVYYGTNHGTYNRILRDAYGRPNSHLAQITNLATVRSTGFTWDADRLLTRGETDQTWNYGYDAKGQVASAHRKIGTEVAAGSQSEYTYDEIGNRKTLKEGGGNVLGAGLRTTTYKDLTGSGGVPGANALNQYGSIERPQTFDVTGKRAHGSATIKVNGPTALTSGDYQPAGTGLYFRKEVANTPTPWQMNDNYEPVQVTQNDTELTPDQGALQHVGPPTFSPSYDADGNLLADGRWSYTWDGENRLIKMEALEWIQPTSSGSYLAGSSWQATRLEFRYDGFSRRISKKTTRLTGNTVASTAMEGYLYDRWNVIMISQLDPVTGAHLARKWSCLWKPDVASLPYARTSWQKAGGVGGLAWLQTGGTQNMSTTYHSYYGQYVLTGNAEIQVPIMDHMGNVRHYIQLKSGTVNQGYGNIGTMIGQVSANLEYDAFGREVRVSSLTVPPTGTPPGLVAGGLYADALPFHFSTKFTDPESGLNYYGYRYYDSRDGRWLSRDPIGMQGGLNIYCIVDNAPLIFGDILGLAPGVITTTKCDCDQVEINRIATKASRDAVQLTN